MHVRVRQAINWPLTVDTVLMLMSASHLLTNVDMLAKILLGHMYASVLQVG